MSCDGYETGKKYSISDAFLDGADAAIGWQQALEDVALDLISSANALAGQVHPIVLSRSAIWSVP